MFHRIALQVCAGCSIVERPLLSTQHRRQLPSHLELVIITGVLAMLAYPIASSSSE